MLGWLLGLVVLAGYVFAVLLSGLVGLLIVIILRGRLGRHSRKRRVAERNVLLLVVVSLVLAQQVPVLGGLLSSLLVLAGFGALTALVTGARRNRAWATVAAAVVRRYQALSTRSLTKGLVARSWPKVEVGPWPGTNVTSFPRGQRLLVMELIRVGWSPRGKSVRPMDPANNTSPTKASRSGRERNTTWPGVWPGQW